MKAKAPQLSQILLNNDPEGKVLIPLIDSKCSKSLDFLKLPGKPFEKKKLVRQTIRRITLFGWPPFGGRLVINKAGLSLIRVSISLCCLVQLLKSSIILFVQLFFYFISLKT